MLKIYEMDCGWKGNIVVVACSMEDAKEMMKDKDNYEEGRSIQEHKILKGLEIVNYGDL